MPEDTSREAIEAKNDEAFLNKFIQKNKRFILASAYKALGRFVTENDDEYSIALIAFHEAVKSYEKEKGDFNAFASLVIKRRLYDYKKSEKRFLGEVSVEPSAMGGDVDEDAPDMALHLEVRKKEAELSEQDTRFRPDVNPVKEEIEALQDLLSGYGFSFFDLTECSPKAEKTKKACAAAVAYMLGSDALVQKMRATRSLPAKEIMEKTKVPQKILERHRKYIIAAIEILNGEYPLLAEYMSYIRKAMVT